ncbi:RNA methyltransferase [soil metagenome]
MLTRREAKLLRALGQRKNREAEGCFLAEGVRVVEDLLASPLRVRLVVQSSSIEDTGRGQDLLARCEQRGVRTEPISESELAGFADTQTPQGVLAIAEIPPGGLDRIELGLAGAVVLVLDAVQDPGNFGTLVRTAEALGAAGVIALPGTTDPWSPKAVRSAAGSSFRLPVVASRWEELTAWLREEEVRVLAAAAGGEPLPSPRPSRAALVVGNEGAGISAETQAHADVVVGIRLRGRAESLNVAAAATILLYELLR